MKAMTYTMDNDEFTALRKACSGLARGDNVTLGKYAHMALDKIIDMLNNIELRAIREMNAQDQSIPDKPGSPDYYRPKTLAKAKANLKQYLDANGVRDGDAYLSTLHYLVEEHTRKE